MIQNKYELVKALGHGGFGNVWLARHLQTHQLVALKLMHLPTNELNSENELKARERFMREVQIALILDHPHVLPAIDYGYMSYGGVILPYLVSLYMCDGTLADIIKDAPPWEHWTLLQTADAILQAAQGLEYLHTREPKLIHQDVKPGNFLIRWEHGQGSKRIVHLYLNDFGISRWQRTPTDMTSQVVGTPGYLSPEQLDGNITWTSDLYSLAVIAHRLLTGHMPTRDANSDQDPPLVPPSQLNPQRIPSPAIDEILLKALKYNPKHRYPSILAFAQALYDAIAQFDRSSDIHTDDERSETDARPHPDALTQKGGSTPLQKAELVQALPDEKLPPIDVVTLDKGKPPVVDRQPETSPPLPGKKPPERKPLSQLSFNQLWSKELPAFSNTLCWSKDGQALVCTFYSEAPVVLSRDGKLEQLPMLRSARMACWAPEGRVLAYSSSSHTVHIYDMDSPSQSPFTLPVKQRPIEGLDWSLHRQLAVWVEGQILVYTLPLRLPASLNSFVPQTLTRPDLQGGSNSVLRWSPNGAFLAAGTYKGMVACWQAQTQTVQWQEPASNTLAYSLAWSPDSTKLAVAFSNRRVAVWDVIKKQKILDWKELPIVPRMISISIDQRLAVASNTGELLFGSLADPAPTATHPGQWLVAWSPTHRELATLDAQKDTELILWGE